MTWRKRFPVFGNETSQYIDIHYFHFSLSKKKPVKQIGFLNEEKFNSEYIP